MKNKKASMVIRLRKLPSLVDVLSTRPDRRHTLQSRGGALRDTGHGKELQRSARNR